MSAKQKFAFWTTVSLGSAICFLFEFAGDSNAGELKTLIIKDHSYSCMSNSTSEKKFRLQKNGKFKGKYEKISKESFKGSTRSCKQTIDAVLVNQLDIALENAFQKTVPIPEDFGFTKEVVSSHFSPAAKLQNHMQSLVARSGFIVNGDDTTEALRDFFDPKPMMASNVRTIEVSPNKSVSILGSWVRANISDGHEEYQVYSPELYDAVTRIFSQVDEEEEEEKEELPIPSVLERLNEAPIPTFAEPATKEALLKNTQPTDSHDCSETAPLIIHKPVSIKSRLLAPNSEVWKQIAWLTIKRNLRFLLAANPPPIDAEISLMDAKSEDYARKIVLTYKTNSQPIDKVIVPVYFANDEFIDWNKTCSDLNKVRLCAQKLGWLGRWKTLSPERQICVELPPSSVDPGYLSWLEENSIWRKHRLPGNEDAIFLLVSHRKRVATVLASLSSDKILHMIEPNPGYGKDSYFTQLMFGKKYVRAKADVLPPELAALDPKIMWPNYKED